MQCDHYKDWKFMIHWKQLLYAMPIKSDNKKNLICTSSENKIKALKNG